MKTVPLRYLATLSSKVLPESTDPSFAFRYIDISQVNGLGEIDIPTEDLTFGAAPSRARKLAAPGDTVVSTVRTYLRAIASVPETSEQLVFSTGFAILSPDAVCPRFLGYACRTEDFVHQVVARSVGVSYPAISPSDLLEIELRVPNVDEQRRIADFLDDRVSRIDRIIAARREQIVRAQQTRDSTNRAAILGLDSPSLRATDLPWALQVGADRVVRRLAHLAVMGTGHTPSRSNEEYWVDCQVPWLTTSDVHRFRRDEIAEVDETELQISELGLQNSAAVLHRAGTVALSRTASAGFSIVMGIPMATSQDFVTWTCGPALDPYFLLGCLRVMRPFLLGYLATGSTHKTIYFPDLMDLEIPVPALSVQQGVAQRLAASSREYWAGHAAMQKQVDLLTEYKSSLITAAVTGELDVTTAGSNIPG